jgi:hypothetical protein
MSQSNPACRTANLGGGSRGRDSPRLHARTELRWNSAALAVLAHPTASRIEAHRSGSLHERMQLRQRRLSGMTLAAARLTAASPWVTSLAALLMLACGSVKTSSTVSPGSSDGGSADANGFDGGVSPGTASIQFTVVGPDSYCATENDCGDGTPTIGIDELGTGTAGCPSVDCTTCSTVPCLGIVCENETGVAITGGQVQWDGSYGTISTCGLAGTTCVGTAFAKPGRYTATMCATPGMLTGGDAEPPQCVASGPPKCGHVAFDFPSSVVAMGTIGP